MNSQEPSRKPEFDATNEMKSPWKIFLVYLRSVFVSWHVNLNFVYCIDICLFVIDMHFGIVITDVLSV